mmetsp:Transcript_11033/g.31794  ORF Transcript_11033/g.31794 Transcript_11033/m.31794 type:complete len:236 (-) Transcript_11033:139-846(-)|eukprot:CAMPEP_0176026596 /NCGR_PEP_ID=MMETSP0120_2-20121206/13030_1 /TAXON_ID=160619 /ORGANISM="Kryptoperidinium foliaceum, Strain CCMP 1326" /LENGTH=235 /DNA_ID=CAMNT_0017359793 /DNA_START=70 /DNA_END=777 /DNA_ORIENTATION=-
MTEALDVSAVAEAVQEATAAAPTVLPQGWLLKESRSQPGCFYYFHYPTGTCSWEPPADATTANTSQNRNIANKENDNASSSETPPALTEERSAKRRKTEATESAPAAASSSNPDEPKQVRVLHILKKHKDSRRPSSWRQPKITQTKEEAKEELQGLLEILIEEEDNPAELQATFEELARTESDCSSAKRGGDLGFFGRRKMQPAFEEASFGLKVGELTKNIVETSSGMHLILRLG